MRACWATCLGDCSDKISGEHIITDAVFLVDAVKVMGLPWCLDDFKTIGLASVVKNVLCEAHNSRLSEADVAAVQVRKALCDVASLSEARNKAQPQAWAIETFSVSGYALERWCLKTLIGIAFGGELPIGNGNSEPGKPSRGLVEIAFGLRRFQPRAGLYWIGDAGTQVRVNDGVTVTTFVSPANRLEGARFWFWGLELLLMLSDGPTGPFSFSSPDGKTTIQPKVWYRPPGLNFDVHGHRSHRLEFAW